MVAAQAEAAKRGSANWRKPNSRTDTRPLRTRQALLDQAWISADGIGRGALTTQPEYGAILQRLVSHAAQISEAGAITLAADARA
ncbi:MAG: hypothetical protein R2911_05650 [Caldilineaceae bacterium]